MLFLYGIAVFLQPGLGGRLRQGLRCRWVFPFLLLYAFTALSLLWSTDLERGAFILEKKAALFALPILVALDGQLSRRLVQGAMLSLVAGCVLALWIALGHAAWQYAQTGGASAFFYHRLGRVLDEFNAVYFSFYVLMSLVFFGCLLRKKAFSILDAVWLRGLVAVTLISGVILLSSRLFIVLALLYGISCFAVGRRRSSGLSPGSRGVGEKWVLAASLVALAGLGLFLNRGRFIELAGSRFEMLEQEEFRWDTPFNGLTLRLLFLKFGWEALREEQAVVQGLGVGDVRQVMNDMVRRYKLYHGNPDLGDTGYLNYSLHNQYMETWLQAGLPALAAWLWLLAWGWKAGLNPDRRETLLWLVLAITAFSFFESVMERQRGLAFIVFFLSTLYSNKTHEDTERTTAGIGLQVE